VSTAPDMTTVFPVANDSQEVALEVAGVSKAFRSGAREIPALQQVSFRVRRGLVTGLVGPDAAGKTTLMRLAAGLMLADAGNITVLGLDAATQSLAVQGTIGYMPQRFGLYEDLTVQENLDLYADLQGVPEKDRVARYRDLLHMAGLAPFTNRLAGRLSGGMKQKLGLACALVRQPSLLLLDEPTVGVDPLSRRELWDIVYRLVHEQAASVLLSTAYLDEAERCDEVVLLHEGRVLAQGTPAALRETMQGRSYEIYSAELDKRTLQARIVDAPGVLDALIMGDRVRMVMEGSTPPVAATLLPDAGAEIAAVAPRFEDCFVALLKNKIGPTGTARGVQPTWSHKIEAGKPVIEVNNLQRRFGSFFAVNHLSFAVERGEVFGLLGANGAGKSTTFRMLCGLLPPSGGTLRVAGTDLRHAAAKARARIGYMSQKFSLYGNLSVVENLRFFSRTYGLTGARGAARIEWALQEFDLRAMREQVSGNLPLGFKQRLALACALMHEPEIIFLDEPTSGVDPLARREFWARINALAGQGVTVMVTTH
jgi:ABC-2 type transport system ATP-binding protein